MPGAVADGLLPTNDRAALQSEIVRLLGEEYESNGRLLTSAAESALDLTVEDEQTVGETSDEILAAASGTDERRVVVHVASGEANGVRVNTGAAATGVKWPVAPGGVLRLNTRQSVHAVRDGASDVKVSVAWGVPA